MTKEEIEILRTQYPEIISLDQFYRIAKVAKRTAVKILNDGELPYVDTGKLTWKYQIKMDDVIDFLVKREKQRAKQEKTRFRKKIKHYVMGREALLREYFNMLYSEYPGPFKSSHVAALTGLSKRTLLNHIKEGELSSRKYHNENWISKESLIDFVCSDIYFRSLSRSETYMKITRGFEIWIKQRS